MILLTLYEACIANVCCHARRRALHWRWPAFGSWALAALVSLPLLVICTGWLQPDAAVWAHLAATVLPQLLHNTLMLWWWEWARVWCCGWPVRTGGLTPPGNVYPARIRATMWQHEPLPNLEDDDG